MTLWRELLYKKLSTIKLEGKVLDLGGSKNSGYHELLGGNNVITVANMYGSETPDLKVDLENEFPISNEEFDAVICVNVLEHIYNYKGVLKESYRVLKQNGKVVIAVPFLVQIHPSPKDYWRFSGMTLNKILGEAGFVDIEIYPIGTGVFFSLSQIFYNFLHFNIVRYIANLVAKFIDSIVRAIKPQSNYSERFYPLGYVVIAQKL